jgi:hypothetical protein
MNKYLTSTTAMLCLSIAATALAESPACSRGSYETRRFQVATLRSSNRFAGLVAAGSAAWRKKPGRLH